jgi:hypothetical protein
MWTFIIGFCAGLAAYHFGIMPLAIDAFVESGARDAIIETLQNVEK